MKKRIACAALALLLIILSLSSCSKDTGENKSLYYPISAEPVSLDPQIVKDSPSQMIINNCYEGLVRTDGEGSIVPGVALSWTVSDNGLVYTFKLRRDTKWALIKSFSKILGDEYEKTFDTRVTAHDFVFGLRRALNPQTNSPDAKMLSVIKNGEKILNSLADPETLGVKADGDYSLTVTLEHRYEDFLYLLTRPAAMPCNETFFNATKGRYGLEHSMLLCNGPFYLYKWNKTTNLIIARNSDYSGNTPVLTSTVSLYINTDTSTYSAKLSGSNYSAAPLDFVPEQNNSWTITPIKNKTAALLFNCSASSLANEKIRKALCCSIERNALETPEGMTAANGLIPECYDVRDGGTAALPEYNPEEARRLFSAGLSEINRSKIEIVLLCLSGHEFAMRELIQRWQQLFGMNISVSISVADAGEMDSSIASGQYDIALKTLSGNGNDALGFISRFSSSGENLCRYSSTEFERLVDNIRYNGIYSGAAKNYAEAENYLIETGAALPLWFGESSFVQNKGVSGITLGRAGSPPCFISALFIDS